MTHATKFSFHVKLVHLTFPLLLLCGTYAGALKQSNQPQQGTASGDRN